MTAWAMLGLEAAGRNPLDVSRAGRNPVGYLRAHVEELSSPGDFARTILALNGAGVDPRSFGGRDLVAALAKRRRGNGSFEGWPNSTAFAVIALRAGGDGGVGQSLSWLAKVQNGDGGWGDVPGSPSTADGTGAVMQAMPDTTTARRGLGYLRQAQRPSGGFPLGGSGAANSQSTAMGGAGLDRRGQGPGLGARGRQQRPRLPRRPPGRRRPLPLLRPSSDQTPVWVTGQVLAAARRILPGRPVAARSASRARAAELDAGRPAAPSPPPRPPPATRSRTCPNRSQGAVPAASRRPAGSSPSTDAPTGGRSAPVVPPASARGREPRRDERPATHVEASDPPPPSPGRRSASASPPRLAWAASSSSAVASVGEHGRGDRDPDPPHPQGIRAGTALARAGSSSCWSWRAGRPTTT
jgi:hypothetical protein